MLHRSWKQHSWTWLARSTRWLVRSVPPLQQTTFSRCGKFKTKRKQIGSCVVGSSRGAAPRNRDAIYVEAIPVNAGTLQSDDAYTPVCAHVRANVCKDVAMHILYVHVSIAYLCTCLDTYPCTHVYTRAYTPVYSCLCICQYSCLYKCPYICPHTCPFALESAGIATMLQRVDCVAGSHSPRSHGKSARRARCSKIWAEKAGAGAW